LTPSTPRPSGRSWIWSCELAAEEARSAPPPGGYQIAYGAAWPPGRRAVCRAQTKERRGKPAACRQAGRTQGAAALRERAAGALQGTRPGQRRVAQFARAVNPGVRCLGTALIPGGLPSGGTPNSVWCGEGARAWSSVPHRNEGGASPAACRQAGRTQGAGKPAHSRGRAPDNVELRSVHERVTLECGALRARRARRRPHTRRLAAGGGVVQHTVPGIDQETTA
jgi:hypothetical protein